MLKFSKIFLLSLIIVFGGCCALFLTAEKNVPIQILEAEESIYHNNVEDIGIDCLMAQDEDASNSSGEYYYSAYNNYYTNSTLVIETVFVNFSDCAMFEPSNYEYNMMQLDSVSNYFEKVSRGNLQVYFNVNVCNLDESISLYKGVKTNIWSDRTLYDKAYSQSVPISENHGDAQVKFLLLSANFNITCDIMFWPHAYPSSQFMVMHHNTADFIVCHELYHTLGLLDLYIGNDNINKATNQEIDYFRPVESEDLMASCQSTNIPTSAHNRYLLGWLGNQSDYSDSNVTAIERIQDSGTYIINEAMQPNGTIAFKFGIDSHEFFMIECRNFNGTKYLIVQRIHDVLSSNINATNQSQCYIYSFRNQQNSVFFGEGDSLGNEINDLFYVRSEANYAIGNIVDLGNNQMQFDFFTVQDTSVEKTFNISSISNSSLAISNAVVYLNGETVNPNAPSSFSLSVKEGDVVTIEHEQYQSLTYIIDAEYVNLSSGDVNLQLYSNEIIINDPQSPDTFQIEVFLNNIQNFVSNNRVFVYINNILQNFSNTIKLNEGDKLKIISDNSEAFSSTYSNGALTNSGNANVAVQNNVIRIALNPAVCNYYLNITDSNNNFQNITSLFLFNNFTKEWEPFSNISLVYKNNVKVYALNHVPFYYTQVKVWHTSYNTTTIASTHINVGNNFYNIQLNKNIIQTTGDFISGIANNIKNWFA